MSRCWSEEDDARLKTLAAAGIGAAEVGALLDRSESAVRARAGKLSVRFHGAACREVRKHLAAGRALVREDVGGTVGVHWASACRSLGSFNAKVCDALLEAGLLKPEADGRSVYTAAGFWL